MAETNNIQIPIQEYNEMKHTIELLKDNELVTKLNSLVDILYKEKYGLYMGEFTEDLTEASINKSWANEKSVWDEV
jgi:hypothetical protein